MSDAMRLKAEPGHDRASRTRTRSTTLRQRHDLFHALLQINLTVLATAHAVSEGIMRGVHEEVTRKSVPQTYGASGRARRAAAQRLAAADGQPRA